MPRNDLKKLENSTENSYFYASSFLGYFERLASQNGEKTSFSFKRGSEWQCLTFQELELNVVLRTSELARMGLQKSTRVAILADASPEWAIAAYATVLAGGVLVPLDTKLGLQELTQCLNHSEAQMILVGDDYKLSGEALLRLCPKLQDSIAIMDFPKYALSAENLLLAKAVKLALPESDMEDTALLCYTSGTLGQPKAVVVPHRTVLFEAGAMGSLPLCGAGDVLMSMLPLNHLFAFNGLLFCLGQGAEIVMAHSLKAADIVECLQERRATVMVTVPLFLDTLKSSLEAKVSEQGPTKTKLFHTLLNYSKILPSTALRRKLFASIHEKIGKDLKYFVCGGSPLSRETESFFELLGLPAYAGYGLTETGPVLAVNTRKNHKPGSVGQAIPGVTLHIEKENPSDNFGEIWTCGPQVFKEYYKDPELSAEHLTNDGWFKTGDLGHIDTDGFVFITGRSRNVIVLNSGKKVHAEEVETLLGTSFLIQDLCIFGRIVPGQGEKVALLISARKDLLDSGISAENLKQQILVDVERICQDLAPYKRPSLIEVYFGDIPKTPLQKVKRGEAKKIFETLHAEQTPNANILRII